MALCSRWSGAVRRSGMRGYGRRGVYRGWGLASDTAIEFSREPSSPERPSATTGWWRPEKLRVPRVEVALDYLALAVSEMEVRAEVARSFTRLPTHRTRLSGRHVAGSLRGGVSGVRYSSCRLPAGRRALPVAPGSRLGRPRPIRPVRLRSSRPPVFGIAAHSVRTRPHLLNIFINNHCILSPWRHRMDASPASGPTRTCGF